MTHTLSRIRWPVLLIVTIVIPLISYGLSQFEKWRRWKKLDFELESICDRTYLSTEGDRIVTLGDDQRKTIAILKLVSLRKRPIGVSGGRLELQNLDVNLLESGVQLEDVFSVTVSDKNRIGELEAKTLRQSFPKCSLWELPRIEWSEAVQRQFEQFPRGSSIRCLDRAPPEIGGVAFFNVGNAGITWIGK